MAGYDLKRFEPADGPPPVFSRPPGWPDSAVQARWLFERTKATWEASWRRRMLTASRTRLKVFGGRRLLAQKEDYRQLQGVNYDLETQWLKSAPPLYRQQIGGRRGA